MPGQVEIVIGPMFAGKTTELIRRVSRAQIARRKTLVVKHGSDTRWESSGTIATHSGSRFESTLTVTSMAQVLDHVTNTRPDYDLIAIDEGQFYADLVDVTDNLANLGFHVLVAALDSNFLNHPGSRGFDQVINLIPR